MRDELTRRGGVCNTVGVPDAQIIHLETLATDNHYPGALPPGWVGLSAAPIIHLENTHPTRRDLAYANDFLFWLFWYFPSPKKGGGVGWGRAARQGKRDKYRYEAE
jgi:hypothetical protein